MRGFTESLCEPLATEDYVVQSMPDASPAKWHLAHTSWFFEQFILDAEFGEDPVDERLYYLFNSYYNAAGDQYTRAERGLLSRPTVAQVYDYRHRVDDRMRQRLEAGVSDRVSFLVRLGLHHEQQHQELLLTDLKHMLAQNPLRPGPYQALEPPTAAATPAAASVVPSWKSVVGGTFEVGYDGDGFAYDNETPRHTVYLHDFALCRRPVTCGQWMAFIDDGGYDTVSLWLSEGWQVRQEQGWQAPLYWERGDDGWEQFTLGGMRAVDPMEPVCHISLYEADAFATWAGWRLPTEQEWEVVARQNELEGNFVESGRLHPAPLSQGADATQALFGDVWEWTRSSYEPYPGFEPWGGAIGEYNGKFMCSQYVLRGGSCATSSTHIRPTYRNFFYPHSRWQFSGMRLARDG